MFAYEKKLQYPVNIKCPNAKMAKIIITQLGGPDGELGASLRYLCQRFTIPHAQVKGLLTDIGTEELSHVEMISTIVYQLTKDLSLDEIKKSGFDTYFVDHTTGIYPIAASGVPFSASTFQVCGDAITDLTEDMAADDAALLGRPLINYGNSYPYSSVSLAGCLFYIRNFYNLSENKKELFRVL